MMSTIYILPAAVTAPSAHYTYTVASSSSSRMCVVGSRRERARGPANRFLWPNCDFANVTPRLCSGSSSSSSAAARSTLHHVDDTRVGRLSAIDLLGSFRGTLSLSLSLSLSISILWRFMCHAIVANCHGCI